MTLSNLYENFKDRNIQAAKNSLIEIQKKWSFLRLEYFSMEPVTTTNYNDLNMNFKIKFLLYDVDYRKEVTKEMNNAFIEAFINYRPKEFIVNGDV